MAASVLASLFYRRRPSDETLALVSTLAESEINRAKLPEYRMDLERVARLSFELDERVKILNFIHEQLLTEDWRRVWNSLNILEILFKNGSNKVLSEFSQGEHFDVLQRLLLLAAFPHDDLRIRELVRFRAREVREIVKEKLEDSTQNFSEPSPPASPQPLPGRKLLSTAPVYIGHHSDTDDDDDERLSKRPPPQRAPAASVQPASAPAKEPLADLLDLL